MLSVNSYALYSLLLIYEDWKKYSQETSLDLFYYVVKSILFENPMYSICFPANKNNSTIKKSKQKC